MLYFRGASSLQTAASTSANQMFALIILLSKTHSSMRTESELAAFCPFIQHVTIFNRYNEVLALEGLVSDPGALFFLSFQNTFRKIPLIL
jgi:hypothetical protein